MSGLFFVMPLDAHAATNQGRRKTNIGENNEKPHK
jgi:hypothetical protein